MARPYICGLRLMPKVAVTQNFALSGGCFYLGYASDGSALHGCHCQGLTPSSFGAPVHNKWDSPLKELLFHSAYHPKALV